MPPTRPEDKQRDETFAAWRERTADWRTMTKIAAQVDDVRKELRAANSTLAGLVDGDEIPESMREHVESWQNAARDAYSLMRELNITSWRHELREQLDTRD
ncbi:hypothetical protein ITP53_11365 [Nonomuraea sp. K274]|uniref:Uncharacterized protein n=1 Tax=Nonomuraea cypriaca TaxID=1187855 RepID=A0A931EYC1_9ACTN|nr:hypothetical protein [Nonomuraea cypriaca]MBF8186337.1 hypothetical protein [Nonomuraea cypriaca]